MQMIVHGKTDHFTVTVRWSGGRESLVRSHHCRLLINTCFLSLAQSYARMLGKSESNLEKSMACSVEWLQAKLGLLTTVCRRIRTPRAENQ